MSVQAESIFKLLSQAKIIFFDFDGVIKESVDIKGQVFAQLFESFGEKVVQRIQAHHLANGGMSRYQKIPLYLKWAKQNTEQESVKEYCDRFANKVWDAVIQSPWVPGVESFIRENPYKQIFVVVSATPQLELESIVDELVLRHCFKRIFGAPHTKVDAMNTMLKELNYKSTDGLMIGDATADFHAAQECHVNFLLRRAKHNINILPYYKGLSIESF